MRRARTEAGTYTQRNLCHSGEVPYSTSICFRKVERLLISLDALPIKHLITHERSRFLDYVYEPQEVAVV
jgi:hypothetical protein